MTDRPAMERRAPEGNSEGLSTAPRTCADWQAGLGRELSAYPVRRTLQTRVSDLDGYGHLNAVRLGHLYEDARAAFHIDTRRAVGRVLVAQLNLRYLAEGRWPGDADVGTAIVRVGDRSFVMGQGLFQAGRCIGLCETILVHTVDGKASRLPDAYRSVLLDYGLHRR